MFDRIRRPAVMAALTCASVILAGPAMAQSTSTDYSTLTGAVDFDTVKTALLAVAAVVVGVYVAIKGIKFVISAIRG